MIGADRFIRQLGQIPRAVEDEVRKALEQGAAEAVAVIDSLAPPALKGRTTWRWGPPPKGARWKMAFGEPGRLMISVYTRDPAKGGEGADQRAHWFEFGTGERVQKTTGRRTGRMPATPFFWPGWRLARKRARARISRALNRGIRKVMGGA